MQFASSMRVVRIEQFGGPEVLLEEMVEVPTPGAGEMLVRNQAAGVNPVDYKIRAGLYPAVRQSQLPYVPGRDVSGIVVQRGPGAARYAIGDAVFAMPG